MKYLTLLVFSSIVLVQATDQVSELDWFLQGHGNAAVPRIVGGSEASPHSIKYQAALYIETANADRSFFCGGSCISKRHILTAAHCVNLAVKVAVVLGAHNLTKPEPTWQIQYSTIFNIHPKWNSTNLHNDIAVITLPEDIQINDVVATVNLPSAFDRFRTFLFECGTVSGWGKDSDSATYVSIVLRYVRLKVIPNLICDIKYGSDNNILCLEGLLGRSPCSGDSGGPLVINEFGKRTLQGVVSAGSSRGCQKGYPSVFTKVSNYVAWIQDVMKAS